MDGIRRCILPCFVLVLLASFSPAQSAPTSTILHCNKLLDVRRGAYVNNVRVLIQDQKIVDVGSGSIPGLGAAHVIDAPGTCLPGLIDVHVHLTSDPEEGGFGYITLGVSIPRETVFGLPASSSSPVNITEIVVFSSAPTCLSARSASTMATSPPFMSDTPWPRTSSPSGCHSEQGSGRSGPSSSR